MTASDMENTIDMADISQHELDQIWTWNATVPEALEACMHELITKNVQQYPDAPAICAWDGALTYRELDELSTTLAYRLAMNGVVPGTIVPLFFEKSMWMSVSTLAVMKAGGASLAVDVGQPVERLYDIITQVKAKVILSSTTCKEIANSMGDAAVIIADGPAPMDECETSCRLTAVSSPDKETNCGKLTVSHSDLETKYTLPTVSPSDLLYVVFTSGSTGRPKGVQVTHRNFCSAIKHQQHLFGFNNSSRVLDFSSHAFDLLWLTMLNTLTAGACLCVPSLSERENDLAGCLAKYNITYLSVTPCVARSLSAQALSKLETLMLGGEAIQQSDLSLVSSGKRLINAYGPSECTPAAGIELVSFDNLSIGRGAGLCPWIVKADEADALAPIGVVGELWLEGPLVGNGYLDNAEKTAAAFIQDPAWLLRGSEGHTGRHGRIYRTGDLARYREDGKLMIVGRKDTQVKIRGQRLELGEVEHHVRQVLDVPDGVVRTQIIAETIQPQGAKSLILLVFLTFEGLEASPEEEHDDAVRKATIGLIDRLETIIPSYMVPSACVPVQHMPMTTTRKLDRKRLKSIGTSSWLQGRTSSEETEQNQQDKATAMEKILQEVWMSVLNRQASEVSLNKTFVRLGGDSITAMQVVSQCSRRGVLITVQDILQAKTIRRLAPRCKAASQLQSEEWNTDKAFAEPFRLSPIQQMYMEMNPVDSNYFNQCAILELKRVLPVPVLQDALQAVVNRHAMLRARYMRDSDGCWKQSVTSEGPDAFAFTTQAVESMTDVDDIIKSQQSCLNIRRGPVFTANVIGTSAGKQILVLTAHHLVIDLVSWRIIWNDIEEFIEAKELQSRKTMSFRMWSKVQSDKASKFVPASVLPKSLPKANFGFWGMDMQKNTHDGCKRSFRVLDHATTNLLLGSGNERMRTVPTDILIGALSYSFSQLFLERSVPNIFIEGHGREPLDTLKLDLSGTVGWFTTLMPIALPITPNTSIVDAVRYSKDSRRSIPGRGLPYFACRYHSKAGRRKFQNHDEMEVLFNFTGQYQQLERQDGLFIRAQNSDGSGARPEIIETAKDSTIRTALIEIETGIEDGRLTISFKYHQEMNHQSRLQQLLDTFAENIAVAAQTLLHTEPSLTLTDLPLLQPSSHGLQILLTEILPSMNITPEVVSDIIPCLPMQEGILFSTRKGAATYANHWVWRCIPCGNNSHISIKKLEDSWRHVVTRHSVLSTVFGENPEDFRPIQIIVSAPKIRITKTTSDSPTTALSEMETPIFAVDEPNHALTICASDSGEVACRLDISHALVDALSMDLIVRDIIRSYDTRNDDRDAPDFRDLVEYTQVQSQSRKLEYWTQFLAGVTPCEFPLKPSPKPITSSTHDWTTVSENATTGIADFCRKMGITRAAFLQVTWAMVLSHFTGMTEVCFGYAASGRDVPVQDIERMVGPLANLLISRVNLDELPSRILEATSERSIESLGFQHVSLAEIQHELGLANKPLFDTAMTIRESKKVNDAEKSSLALEECAVGDPHEFALTLNVDLNADKTDVTIISRTALISHRTAQEICFTLALAFEHLISAISNTDKNSIGEPFAENSLSGSWLKRLVGTDETDCHEFWASQFEGLQGTHFPQAKAAAYSPSLNADMCLNVARPDWKTCSFQAATIVKAAWSVVAARAAGADEGVFGVSVDRSWRLQGSQQTLGVTTSLLPLRVPLCWDKNAKALLESVDAQASAMIPFQHTSLRCIRSISEESAAACAFQSVLVLRQAQHDEDPPEKSLESKEKPGHDWSAYALVVHCQVKATGLGLRIEFDSNVIDETQVRRLAHQFHHIVHQLSRSEMLVENLWQISSIGPKELEEIWNWNAAVPESIDACLHELISQKVYEQPQAPAICACDGDLTYKELDDLSTALAHYLVDIQISHGDLVPLLFEKSKWMPVTALAVMKAGGAAIAIDTTQPDERLQAIMTQSKAQVMLSSAKSEHLARRIGDYRVVVISDTHLQSILSEPRPQSQLAKSCPSQLAYVVFTSGSTGTPKGVQIAHRNISSAAVHQRKAMGYTSSCRVLDIASYAFDAAWHNLAQALTCGACLCIPSVEERENNLDTCLGRYQVTHALMTPSVARYLEQRALSKLSTIIVGGETVLPSDARLGGEHTVMMNAYGPSECTPVATCGVLTPDNVRIGNGVGVCTWVVDPDQPNTLTPIGAIGELWIEGPTVGPGYLNQPETTAAAFIQDPEWLVRGAPGQPGRHGRLFRTGDLVRYDTNGSLTYVARKDTQVKIRGQRVELGEVEHHVRRTLEARDMEQNIQLVAEAIRPKGASGPMLIVFLSIDGYLSSENEFSNKVREATSDLSERLEKVLPSYMVPTAYFPIETIPITTNGKADRRRLQAIGASLTASELTAFSRAGNTRCLPQTSAERLMQRLWADVLRVSPESISADDNFFRTGGDSIRAMQLVSAVRNQQLGFTVRDVFQNPILRDLASLAANRNADVTQIIPPFSLLDAGVRHNARRHAAHICQVESSRVVDILPCTPMQEGLLARTAQRPGEYVTRFFYQIKNNIDIKQLRGAWEQVVALNPILRTRIIYQRNHGLLQAVLDEPVQWNYSNRLDSIFEDGFRTSVGLGTALNNFTIISAECYYFIWEVHHALYDGWTLPLLLEQVESTYFHKAVEPLESMGSLVRYLQTYDEKQASEYWQSQFASLEGPHFPVVNSINHVPEVNEQFDVNLKDLEWAHVEATPATIIRAAWATLLASRARSKDAVFGAIVTGRQAAVDNIERTAGPVLASVPVRVHIDWNNTASHLLQQVQEQAVDMIPYEQTGLQRIRPMSQEAAFACDFQSLLVIQPAGKVGYEAPKIFETITASNGDNAQELEGISAYAIVVQCQADRDEATLQIGYDSSLIEESQATSIANQFEHLIRRLSDSKRGQEKLHDVAMIGQQDIEDIWAWNAEVPETIEKCVHHLIQKTVQQQPDAPALCAWDGSMTYAQLDDFSHRLADKLASIGTGPGVTVALCFEKSMWMAVAALAVVKTGACSVALATEDPEERLCEMVSRVCERAPVILCSVTNNELAGRLGAADTLAIGPELFEKIPAADHKLLAQRDASLIRPNDPIYTVFTTGTVGMPKASVISHQNISSSIHHQQQAFDLTSASRVLDVASYASDIAWFNLFQTLTAGACLCIPSASEIETNLLASLRRYSPTFWATTPSEARLAGAEVLSGLDKIALVGEPISSSDLALTGCAAQSKMGYGLSECTTFSTVGSGNCDSGNISTSTNVSIGHGKGLCTWVVDVEDDQVLVPVGSVGELWLEGPLVSQGYFGDPERTVEAFVEDPVWLLRGSSGHKGRHGRLFRTGDLVRYESNGSLIFVGRKTKEAKVRGQHLEFSHIEYHLWRALMDSGDGVKLDSDPNPEPSHVPGVSQTIVDVIRPLETGASILVAFIGLDGADRMTEESHSKAVLEVTPKLTEHLRQTLPAHMVPFSYIPVRKFPLLVTGKTDRKLLGDIGLSSWLKYRGETEDLPDDSEPVNEVERMLQEVWGSVLNLSVENISLTKPFIQLGGDSITAMQIVSECRSYDVETTVSDILQARTIRNLASRCRVAVAPLSEQPLALENANSLDDSSSFGLSPVQQMFFDLHPDGLNHFNQATIMELTQTVKATTLKTALQAIVLHHSMLRARYKKTTSGSWEQYIPDEGTENALIFSEHFVDTISDAFKIANGRQSNLDIERGPIFACDLINVRNSQQILALTAHHLVVDFMSWRIIWSDIEQFMKYGALNRQKTLRFRTWFELQTDIGSTLSPASTLPYSVPASDLEFWDIKLSENTFNNTDIYTVKLNVDTSSLLLGISNESLRTEPVDILLGTLAYSFSQLFPERTSPTIFLEGHGREQLDDQTLVDSTGTVGWFTTLCPIPISVGEADAILDVVRKTKDNRNNIPAKGLPYFACRYHSPAGRLAFQHHEAAEIVFNFAGNNQQFEASDSLFRQLNGVDDYQISEISGLFHRFGLIDVSATVEGGQLSFSFLLNRQMKHQDRLKRWPEEFAKSLQFTANKLLKAPAGLTLSDIPLVPLSYEALDGLLATELPGLDISPKDIEQIYPCSPIQDDILVSRSKGDASYANYCIWRCLPGKHVKSAKDVTAFPSPTRLESAWRRVCSRHPMLSTIFCLHPEGLGHLQIVLAEVHPRILHKVVSGNPVATLSSLEPPEYAPNMPPHTLTICYSAAGQVACRLDISHALVDASSMSLLAQETAAAYDNADLPVAAGFGEMIRYMNKLESKDDTLAYWARFLSQVQVCQFPPSISASSTLSISSRNRAMVVPPDCTAKISSFCRKMEITRSVFLQVAWAMVLSRFTGTRDVCFGYVASKRDFPIEGINHMVGAMLNMLICRIYLDAPLDHVLRVTAEASTKQLGLRPVSLSDIQHQLSYNGDQLFNTAMSVRQSDGSNTMTARSISLEQEMAEDPHKYDLTLVAGIDGEDLDVAVLVREGFLNQQDALELLNTLTQAIEYLSTSACNGPLASNALLTSELVAASSHTPNSLYGKFFQQMVGTDHDSAVAFWKSQFADLEAAEFPPSSSQGPCYKAQINNTFNIPVGQVDWAGQEFSPEIIFRAAWSSVMARATGSSDCLFGVPAGTHKQEFTDSTQSMLMPVRIRLDWDNSAHELLKLVQNQAAEASPFERMGLQRIRLVSEAAALACEFRSLLVVRTCTTATMNSDDDTARQWQSFGSYSAIVKCSVGEEDSYIKVGHDSNVVSESTMKRIAHQLTHSIHQLCDPGKSQDKLRTLAGISPKDLKDVWNWNITVPDAIPKTIHILFMDKAREQPERPAICAWDGHLTYARLDQLSTQLAYQLIHHGVGPGTFVPLCFEKSMWMAVAAFAVMKAGGASVSLDPTQPQGRLRDIITQVKPNIVLASISTQTLAQTLSDCTVMPIGNDCFLATTPLHNDELPVVKPSDLLYLVFTSGTTGKPKGAMITHQNFSGAIFYQQKALGLTNKSRVFDFASYAFDMSWLFLLQTMAAGGCLCVPSDHERQNALAECLEKYNIGYMPATPSVARQLGQSTLSKISTLFLGGEAVMEDDIDLVGPGSQIINAYGPTECTPMATVESLAGKVSIGRGFGVCTWVVDPQDSNLLAPIGAVGELWLEGSTVGYGYLDKPDETAASFIRDPSWLLKGTREHSGRHGRLYRTGDLVRYNEDGKLIFIGRKDTQVKIRGQRIELSEVEQHVLRALRVISAIEVQQSAHVTVETIRPIDSHNAILVAFVTLDGASELTEEEHNKSVQQVTSGLPPYLTQTLPSYMVPTAYIPVRVLPMTATGKVNRQQLQTLGELSWKQHVCGDSDQLFEPRTEIEHIVNQVWISVLQLSTTAVPANKKFTHLGGDSITAMQVVSQCRARHVMTTVGQVLRAASIDHLTSCCQLDGRYKSGLNHVSDEYEALHTPFGLSPAQKLFFDTHPDDYNLFNHQAKLEFTRPISAIKVKDSIRAIVRRHVVLRTRFNKSSSGWNQRIVEDDENVFEFIEYPAEDSFKFAEYPVECAVDIPTATQSRQKLFDIQQKKCLDINRGPIFACSLFSCSGYAHTLMLNCHPLVIDSTSWRIIKDDLESYLQSGHLRPPNSATFDSWSSVLSETGSKQSPPAPAQKDAVPEADWQFYGLSPQDNTYADMVCFTETLDERTSVLILGDCNKPFRTEPQDILIGALIHSFHQAFPEKSIPAVHLERSDRNQPNATHLDLKETVGPLTTVFPIRVPTITEIATLNTVRMVKDARIQVLSSIQAHQICGDGSTMELLFNFIDESPLQLSREARGIEQDICLELVSEQMEAADTARRPALIEVTVQQIKKRIVLSFAVSSKMVYPQRLREWLKNYAELLQQTTVNLVHTTPRFTLTDFPLLSLSYDSLDRMVTEQLPSLDIEPTNISDIYPCSPLQDGMMLSLNKGVASYSNFLIWQIVSTGPEIDVLPSRLEDAWMTVLKRHPIFSTVFALHPNGMGFMQIVLSERNPRLSHKRIHEGSTTAALWSLDRPKFQTGEPPYAVTICQSTSGEVSCRLDISHLLYDGISLSILTRELTAAYDGLSLPLAPKFGEMIRHLTKIPKLETLESWSKFLRDSKPCLFPVSSSASLIDECYQISIPSRYSEIPKFCRRIGITHSVFLHIAWAMVLSQFTGRHNVCFGYLVSGRHEPVDGIESMVGPLANLLISCVNLDAPMGMVVGTTSDQLTEHLSMQQVSLAEIQRRIGHTSGPMFNTALAIREADKLTDGEEGGILLQDCRSSASQEFDLTVEAILDGSDMDIAIMFRKSHVPKHVANECCAVLVEAVDYLLMSHGGHNTHLPVYDDFFNYIVGAGDMAVTAFWKSQFEGFEGIHFPHKPLQYTGYTQSQLEHTLRDLKWNNVKYRPTTVLRAVWSLVTAGHAGSSDTIFGSTAGPIGMVPMRVSFKWDDNIESLLQEVQAQAMNIAPYERTGLRTIQRVSPKAAQACDFQSILAVQTIGDDTYSSFDYLADSHLAAESRSILIHCQVETNNVNISTKFDSNVIHESEMKLILRQFSNVLHRVLADMESGTMNLRDAAGIDQHDLDDVWRWNAATPEPIEALVHTTIFDKAKNYPDATAIFAWDGELTYGELDELSTKLAHHLINMNIGPGSTVPLIFEKSKWTSVAIFGVMKSGGACVALDMKQPINRLRNIVDQIDAKVILSSISNEHLAQQLRNCHILTIDEKSFTNFVCSSKPALSATDSSNLLYIVFTSGSTGTPKGVQVTHGNFSSALVYQKDKLGFTGQSQVLDFVSYAFDISWLNSLFTFAAGGCLCVPSQDERENRLSLCLQKYGATTAVLTPSIARLIGSETLSQLSSLILIGEAAVPSDKLLQSSGKLHMCNSYGPAECTPISTFEPFNAERVGIGRGYGLCTWVVDTEHTESLVPIGTVGELWLEGPLVCKGYLNNDEKTSDSFIDNPPWLLDGAPGYPGRSGRLYRTGDLVRYKEDGSLVFIGRKDNQVKIRGQRVELSEVEHYAKQALGNIEAIFGTHAVVVAQTIRPRASVADILVVIVSLAGAGDISEDEHDATVRKMTRDLIHHLSEMLPIHMVPTTCIPMRFIPMTASGKIDRRQICSLGSHLTVNELTALGGQVTVRREPQTDTERLIQRLWAETLQMNLTDISANDSFFLLGGDSIGAMRLVGLASTSHLQLTVGQIFQNPILEDMGRVAVAVDSPTDETSSTTSSGIAHQTDTACSSDSSDGETGGTKYSLPSFPSHLLDNISGVFPLTQQQQSFIEDDLRSSHASWSHIYLDLPNSPSIEHVRDCCYKLVTQFEILRTVFTKSSSGFVQVILDNMEPKFDIFSVTSGNLETLLELTVNEDLQTDWRLEQSTVRFVVLQGAGDTIRLVLRLSHALYDGISLQLMMQAFFAFYNNEIPSKDVGFSSFMRHMTKKTHDNNTYWKEKLKGAKATKVPGLSRPLTNGPEDKPLTVIHGSTGAIKASSSITPATVFTTACAVALGRVTGDTNVVFGRVVSGRAGLPVQLQSVVGPCISALPVMAQVQRGCGIDQVVDSIQSQYVESLTYESIDSESPATRFSFITQYQNIDELTEVDFGETATVKAYERLDRNLGGEKISVFAKPQGDVLQVSISAGQEHYSRETIQGLHDVLCGLLREYTANADDL